MIKLGQSSHGRVDFAVQRLTTLQLDQISELGELVDQVKEKTDPTWQRLPDRSITSLPRNHASVRQWSSLGMSVSVLGLPCFSGQSSGPW